MQSFKRPYAALAALIGFFALVLQFFLTLRYAAANGETQLYAALRYFSFFTILTNTLGALSLLATAMMARPNFLTRRGVQTAIAIYFVVVSAVYTLLLRNLWNPAGAQQLADYLLHYVMPLLYLIYWLVFVPRGTLRYSNAVLWLIYPALYVVWVIARGAVIGEYPYPFLDAGRLGYAATALNSAGLGAVFLALGLIAIWIDRKLAKASR